MIWKTPVVLAALLAAVPAVGANPKDCLEISMKTASPADGNYVIEPVPGRIFTVYCRGMPWRPVEYLTLVNTGGAYNFGQYTAGGASPGTDVRTSFTKVRIDPTTLLVDIGDLTYATSTGQLMHSGAGSATTKVPYGVALACNGGSTIGVANIDLTGTPFRVSSQFVAHGSYPTGSVSLDGATPIPVTGGYPFNYVAEAVMTGKVLNVTGTGRCGSTGPRGVNSHHGSFLVASPGVFALQLEYVGQ